MKMRALLLSRITLGYAGMVQTPGTIAEVRAARGAGTTMPVDEREKRSSDSAAMLPYWLKTEAIVSGIEAMREAGTTFLPQFADESAGDYKYRLANTKVTNVFRDVVEGLASKPFQENITLVQTNTEKPPAEIEAFQWDVDGSGNTLTVFAAETFFNGIAFGGDWIFVDHPPRDPRVVNMADYKKRGYRPYWTHVLARNVLDVQSKVINGYETLTYIKLFEPGEPDHVREFTRHDDGTVTWELYEKRTKGVVTDGTTQYVSVGGGTVSIGVIPLVPFFTGRRAGRRWRFYPAMQDAADLQIELYQQESGLKFAKTLTAYPMLAANGITPPVDKVTGQPVTRVAVGPNRVLWSTADGSGNIGNWEYLEPGSESLKFLAEDIKSTIQELRELGRLPLTAQSGNITVITAAVAAGKAKSAVKAWAFGLQNALEEALLITSMWLGVKYDPDVNVYTEFDEFTEGEDLDALATMRQSGDISQETLWDEMQRRSVLSTKFDANVERQRLLTELPTDTTEGEPPAA